MTTPWGHAIATHGSSQRQGRRPAWIPLALPQPACTTLAVLGGCWPDSLAPSQSCLPCETPKLCDSARHTSRTAGHKLRGGHVVVSWGQAAADLTCCALECVQRCSARCLLHLCKAVPFASLQSSVSTSLAMDNHQTSRHQQPAAVPGK